MSKFELKKMERINERDYKKWKNELKDFIGSTIFHDPDFLSYHGAKFEEYHIGVFKGEELFGILPLAIVENENEKFAKSPYGASYGGFVFKDILNYSDSKEIVEKFIELTKDLNINSIVITPSLEVYNDSYSDTFIFALLEKGFYTINSDITSIVDLSSNNLENEVFTSRARNMVRKARKANVQFEINCNIYDFWILMEKTFQKHGTNPTHTKEELIFLQKTFPNDIYFNIAYIDNTPVAGMGVFNINELCSMSFYLCSDSEFQHTQALSLVVYESVLSLKSKGFKYFDFGTSSVNMIGRENIFRFKESFGAVGRFRHTYKLELK